MNSRGAPDAPSLASIIDAVLTSMPQGASADDTAETVTTTPPPTGIGGTAQGAGAGGTDILSSLLSNPELISKLPQILSLIKPVMEMLASGNTTTTTSDQQAVTAGAMSKSHQAPHDDRSALLCAMKPYLGRERREAIDYIIKLARLGDILKSL